MFVLKFLHFANLYFKITYFVKIFHVMAEQSYKHFTAACRTMYDCEKDQFDFFFILWSCYSLQKKKKTDAFSLTLPLKVQF